jgi:outer membrane protein
MRNHLKMTVSFILLMASLPLLAQQPLNLSLDSAVNYAVNHNKTLMNSRFAIDKSAQKVKEAISAGLPQVNAALDYSNFLGAQAEFKISDAAPPAVIEFNPTSNFKATVSQLVFSGNYFLGVQLSKLAKAITEQSYEKDELTVKEQTMQAYYMVLANERILNILIENRKNVRLIFEKTSNLANAGMIEQTDPKKISIMATSVENALKSSERQVEMAYNLLRLQSGMEPGQKIQLTTGLEEIARQHIIPVLSTDTFNIDRNQDYKLLTLQEVIAKKSIDLRKSNYLPTVAAYYSYTEKLLKPLFDISPKNVVGLTLNIPIFSSGQRSSQLSQARIDYKVTENTKALFKQQLSLQEQQLRYNYNNLLEQYLNQKANVEIAKEVLDKMNLKFEQGVVSSLELTSSNNDYLTAETNYTSVLLQLLNAELSFRKINSNL